ncbi:hypothetical protein E2P81_ATG08032 [Venturia nashicola]|uniref:Fe2OG dioxygenase domain-containing protein n=1 Tax=Venturia nashicola TaxID=86259 RepID=A0A4Z1P175_9PEZI|nr:hypothetical protein E6O75_ATG08206 [Venturia nashicola]TLD26220.1 hypothetical protein E2P81_ATG08032 [Venturia nashicola]
MSRNTTLEQSILEKSKGQKPLKRTQFLIVLNLQNEFASSDGRLPCNDLGFVHRIKELVPKFREKVGGIIWVRTEYQVDRQVNDGLEGSDTVVLSDYQDLDTVPVPEESPKLSPTSPAEPSNGKKLKKKKSKFSFNIRNMTQSKRDSREEKIPQTEARSPSTTLKPPPAPPGPEELFLASNYAYERKCVPGTTSVDFVPEIKSIIEPVDTQITTSHYSATKGTNLLVFLQSRFAQEVYICGCISNLSIHATLIDMTGSAFDLRVIEDCLGFRTLQDHQISLDDLLDERMTDVGSIESSKMHEDLDAPAGTQEDQLDIVDSMSAMTIASGNENGEPTVRSTARRPSPSPGLKANKVRMRPRDTNLPTLGPGDKIGEGDSTIRYDLLPLTIRDELDDTLPLSDTIFAALYYEVQWQKMYHVAGEVPRLVAVQGTISTNGDKPVYRHPSDQSPPLLPFTKNVNIIRREAEKIVGHELNHVLIQLYRDGNDFISEHSDKTLDIMPGSKIVNASFGAQRTMRLRTKKSGLESEDSTRETQRIPMPHNSLFALGLVSNKIWLHGINPDKRLPAERSPEELAYNGKRISLTFRYIGTFLDREEKLIWGQGAVGRSRDEARSVVNGNEVETEKMIQAFSNENREGANFLWREAYGCGFDVLHFRDMEVGSGH